MGKSKYKYTPDDVALLLVSSDLRRSQEEIVIKSIFQNLNSDISAMHRNSYDKFRKLVRDKCIYYETSEEELDDIHLIMKEAGCSMKEEQPDDLIERYFRLIKLQLMYTDIGFKRLKLRTIINDFNYKRRSEQLTDSIKHTLNMLKLKIYLKDYVPCDISEIKLDQMIMIRLS